MQFLFVIFINFFLIEIALLKVTEGEEALQPCPYKGGGDDIMLCYRFCSWLSHGY